jgi:ribose transport system ATP-binding protein
VAFVVFLIIAVTMEFALRRRPWGWRLRAVGSNEDCARRIGINVTRTVVLAYVGSSLFVFLGALMFMGQYGIGDPAQGAAFTSPVSRGRARRHQPARRSRTFIGTLVAAVLLQQC